MCLVDSSRLQVPEEQPRAHTQLFPLNGTQLIMILKLLSHQLNSIQQAGD